MQRSMARIGLRPTSALNISGDAILKAVMAEQLVHLMGDADEGRLSKVSAQAVSGRHWRALPLSSECRTSSCWGSGKNQVAAECGRAT